MPSHIFPFVQFSCHPQLKAGCEIQQQTIALVNTSRPPTIRIGSRPSPFPSNPYCRPFPATKISSTKESIVCIITEPFCRPFPTVNSLGTGILSVSDANSLSLPLVPYARKCITVKHILQDIEIAFLGFDFPLHRYSSCHPLQ